MKNGKLIASAAGLIAITGLCVLSGRAIAGDYDATMPADRRYVHLQRILDMQAGRELKNDTTADIQAFTSMGWLQGVYAALILAGEGRQTVGICPTTEFTNPTMARIYVKYMDAHPETHQLPDLAVAVISAEAAYPCRAEK